MLNADEDGASWSGLGIDALLAEVASTRRSRIVFVTGNHQPYVNECVLAAQARGDAVAVEGALDPRWRDRLSDRWVRAGLNTLTAVGALLQTHPAGVIATIIGGAATQAAPGSLQERALPANVFQAVEQAGSWLPAGRAGLLVFSGQGVDAGWVREFTTLAARQTLLAELPLLIVCSLPTSAAEPASLAADEAPITRAAADLVEDGLAEWVCIPLMDETAVAAAHPGTDEALCMLLVALAEGLEDRLSQVVARLKERGELADHGDGLRGTDRLTDRGDRELLRVVRDALPGMPKGRDRHVLRLLEFAALQGESFCGATVVELASSTSGQPEGGASLLEDLADPGDSLRPLNRSVHAGVDGATDLRYTFRDRRLMAWAVLRLTPEERRERRRQTLTELVTRHGTNEIHDETVLRLARILGDVDVAERYERRVAATRSRSVTDPLVPALEKRRKQLESEAGLLLDASRDWDPSDRYLLARLLTVSHDLRFFGLLRLGIDTARASLRQATQRCELGDEASGDARVVDDLAAAHTSLGRALDWSRRQKSGLVELDRALELRRRALAGWPSDARTRLLARGLLDLASAHAAMGHHRVAIGLSEESRDLVADLMRATPTLQLSDLLVSSEYRLGLSNLRLGFFVEATAHLAKSLAGERHIVEKEPTPVRRMNMAMTLWILGNAAMDPRSPATAAAHYREASDIFSELLAEAPSPDLLSRAATCSRDLGTALKAIGDQDGEIVALAESARCRTLLWSRYGEERSGRRGELASVLRRLGRAHLQRGGDDDARSAVRHLADAADQDRTITVDSAGRGDRFRLASTLQLLGIAYGRTDASSSMSDARTAWQEACTHLEELGDPIATKNVQRHLDDLDRREQHASSYGRLEVSTFVRHKGEGAADWRAFGRSAVPGSSVEHLIRFKNTSDETLRDMMIGCNLSMHQTYVEGSTHLLDGNNRLGRAISNDNITRGGVNVGSYGPGAVGYVWFEARIDPVAGFPFTNGYQLATTGFARPRDTEDVTAVDVLPVHGIADSPRSNPMRGTLQLRRTGEEEYLPEGRALQGSRGERIQVLARVRNVGQHRAEGVRVWIETSAGLTAAPGSGEWVPADRSGEQVDGARSDAALALEYRHLGGWDPGDGFSIMLDVAVTATDVGSEYLRVHCRPKGAPKDAGFVHVHVEE